MSYAAPNLTWVFAVCSVVGARDREEHVSAPVDADFYELELGLFRAGYIRVNLLRKEWERWAWPGGYPIYYLCDDGGVLCSKCANDNIKMTSDPGAERDWKIVAADINYEDAFLVCDHCGEYCESAYGDNNEQDRDEPYCDASSADAEALASAGHGTDEDYGSAEDML